MAVIERAGIELREGVESEWTIERSPCNCQKDCSKPRLMAGEAAADAGSWPGIASAVDGGQFAGSLSPPG